MPARLSGRRRCAYSPVPMKLHPTAGPNTAHTARSARWSLDRMIAAVTAPQTSAAMMMRTVRRRMAP